MARKIQQTKVPPEVNENETTYHFTDEQHAKVLAFSEKVVFFG